MNIHKNARLTPHGRADLVRSVEAGQPPAAVGAALGVSMRTVRKWVARFKARRARRACRIAHHGRIGFTGRPRRQSSPRSKRLRRQRFTGKQIAAELGISPATVSRILRRLGLNSISALEPAEPVRRYERAAPRRADPHRHQEARPFRPGRPSHHRRPHRPAQQPWRRLGVRPCRHRRCLAHRLLPDPARREEGERHRLPACRRRLLRKPRHHRRPRHDRQRLLLQGSRLPQCLPRSRPQAHQDQTLHAQDQRQGRALHPDGLREWAYAQAYPTSEHRGNELPRWLHRYNWHRPTAA